MHLPKLSTAILATAYLSLTAARSPGYSDSLEDLLARDADPDAEAYLDDSDLDFSSLFFARDAVAELDSYIGHLETRAASAQAERDVLLSHIYARKPPKLGGGGGQNAGDVAKMAWDMANQAQQSPVQGKMNQVVSPFGGKKLTPQDGGAAQKIFDTTKGYEMPKKESKIMAELKKQKKGKR